MKPLILAAALAFATPVAAADAEDAAILAQVERFFGGMRAQDAAALNAVVLDDATLTSQAVRPDGVRLRRTPAKGWIEGVSGQVGLDERMWDPVVMRRGPIAMVWAPYEFRVNGKSTHCGIDVFDMVKVEGTWKIAHLMWTQEPGACAELKAPKTP